MVDSASVELRATQFKALGDSSRLRILTVLSGGPACVCTLRDHTGLGGPLMSHHLTVLREAGLVTATRRGRWIDYALAEGALEELSEILGAVRPGPTP